jgi:hypothetical protein
VRYIGIDLATLTFVPPHPQNQLHPRYCKSLKATTKQTQQKITIFSLYRDLLLGVARGEDVLDGLVRALEILLDGDVVLDPSQNERGGDHEGGREEDPVADELLLVGEVAGVEVVDHGGTDGLDALVETDEVGRAAARVRQSAHEPVWRVSKKRQKGGGYKVYQ